MLFFPPPLCAVFTKIIFYSFLIFEITCLFVCCAARAPQSAGMTRERLSGVTSLLPLQGSWELNLGPQTWQQAPFPANLSILPTPLLDFFKSLWAVQFSCLFEMRRPCRKVDWVMVGERELLPGRLRQAGKLESPTKGYSPQGSYSSVQTSSSCLRPQLSHRIVEQRSLKIQMLLRLDCPEGIGVDV